MRHTKEPWFVSVEPEHINNQEGDLVACAAYPFEANARRIVACVNACVGISTDSLDQEGSAVMGWQRTARKLIDVTKQRDDLLDALNLLYSWAYNWDSEFMNDPDWINGDYPKIQEAIAYTKE